MAFQKIVVVVAGLLLVVSLIIMAVIIARSRSQFAYPPVQSDCPDYWEMHSINGANTCVNTKSLGNSSCPSKMDFSVSPWSNSNSLCKKQLWARNCDLTWDGVTNSATVCSSSGTPITPGKSSTASAPPSFLTDAKKDWNKFTASL